MDPFIETIVAALASGALAAAKDTASEAVKDAYHGVRDYIVSRYKDVELKGLEKDPKSKSRQEVVKEDFSGTDVVQDEDLPKLLQALLETLQNHAPDASKNAGVEIGDLRGALDVQLKRVGTAGPVKIGNVSALAGSIVVEDIGYTAKNLAGRRHFRRPAARLPNSRRETWRPGATSTSRSRSPIRAVRPSISRCPTNSRRHASSTVPRLPPICSGAR